MADISRRALLVAGGAVALGGCMSGTSDETARSEQTSEFGQTTPPAEFVGDPLGDQTRALVDRIPVSVGEASMEYFVLYRPNDLDMISLNYVVDDPESVALYSRVSYSNGRDLYFLKGSFESLEVTSSTWEDAAKHSEPGLFVADSGDDTPWQGGVDAVESSATGTVGDDSGMLRVLRAVPDHPFRVFRNLRLADRETESDVDPQYLAEAREHKTAQRRTHAVTFANPSGVETLLEAEPLPDDATVQRKDGRLLVFTEPNPLAEDDDVEDDGRDYTGTRAAPE